MSTARLETTASARVFPALNISSRITLLGYIEDRFVVLDRDRQMLFTYSSAQMTSTAIHAELGLKIPRTKIEGLQQGQWLMEKSIELGPFDPNRVRLERLERINHLDTGVIEALAEGRR